MGGLDATAMQWVLLFVAATTALLAFFFSSSGKQKLRLPPGPAGLPVFGNLGIFVTSSHPHQELDRLSKKYGPLMSLRMGSKQALVVSSPEMAKEVLKTFDKEFANRPKVTARDALLCGDKGMGLAPYGPLWRFGRKIVTLQLLTLKRTQQFEGVREEELSAMLRSIFEDSQKPAMASGAVDMNQRTTYFTMNLMTRVLMNKRFYSYNKKDVTPSAAGQQPTPNPATSEEELAAEFKQLIEQVFFLTGVSMIGDVIPYLGFLDRIMNYKAAMQRVRNRYDSFLGGVVEEHRQHQQQGSGSSERDFVDILLSLPGEDGVGHLDEARIKGLLTEMLNAGTETSSTTLQWGLSELLRHPPIMHKLQSELDSVVGKHRVVAESDIPELPYLQAVVKEVFRLHPAGPLLIPHESTQPCRVGGYDVPAGTTTFVNVWSIGRNPAAWDQPLLFNPDRFLNRDTDVRGQHYELLPFGSGRRGCPGMHLALAVVHYGLGRLVHSFDWKLPEGQGPQDLDMAEKFGLTLPRATPLLAVPSPRLPPHLY